MRFLYLCLLLSLFSIASYGQSKSITASEYESAFRFAVSETNARFPFVHTFTSEHFEAGKLVSESTHIAERQASGVERQSFATTEGGTTTRSFQLRTGYGENVYCSSDGASWLGPQTFECPRSIRLYRPEPPTSVEYSVEEKVLDRKKVREYRKFEVRSKAGKSTFTEEVALIGQDQLFISTIETMGDLTTRRITTRLTNSWKLNADFPAIVAPKDAKPATQGSKKGNTLTISNN